MKPLYYIPLLLCLCNIVAGAQTVVTVNEIELFSSAGKSYIVNRQGKLLRGVSGSVFKGTSPFFIKANKRFHNAPSPLKNFVRSQVFDKVIPPSSTTNGLKSTSYEYYDALGVSTQTVKVGQSPNKHDVVSFVVRDKFQREVKRYLPYSQGRNGRFQDSVVLKQKSFYNSNPRVARDTAAYSKYVFDNSPRNAVTRISAPGWRWHSKAAPNSYRTKVNSVNEVKLITFGPNDLPVIKETTFYGPGILTVEETCDEGGLRKKLYKNFRGEIVLEKTGDSTEWHDTYFVYDPAGKIRYTFPPAASARLAEFVNPLNVPALLDTLCFQWKYDELGRVNENKTPGVAWTYTIYDNWDRTVMVQTGNLRAEKKWLFTKYDIHNRPIMTGIIVGERSALQADVKAATFRFEERERNSMGYTNRTYPSHSEQNLLTIDYYDCYSFLAYPGWDVEGLSYLPQNDGAYVSLSQLFYRLDPAKTYDPVIRNYKTGSKVKVLDGPLRWLNSVQYFNKEYKLVQTVNENHLGGVDVLSQVYNPTSGLVVMSKQTHAASKSTVSLQILEEITFDHADRPLMVRHAINQQAPVVMSAYKYNELGQKIEENIHSVDGGNTFLQSIDYRYNIQGWLTHINNSALSADTSINVGDGIADIFGMEIIFNGAPTINAFLPKDRYDGNIAAVKWRSTNSFSVPTIAEEKIYGFKYDNFKRFLEGRFGVNSGVNWNTAPDYYSELISGYDQNGNIGGAPGKTLVRFGRENGLRVPIDNLAFSYKGNQLQNVTDAGSASSGFVDLKSPPSLKEFTYDNNGNMVADMNKNIGRIEYNHLNLPIEIRVLDQRAGRWDRLVFTYDASGKKLRKQVYMGSELAWTTDYVNGIQYDNGVISFFQTSKGRAVNNGTGFDYQYYFKDFQDNVRVVYGLLKETKLLKATMEQAMHARETQDGFRNLPESRSKANNTTAPNEEVTYPEMSSRCNSYSDASTRAVPVGAGNLLKVSANDAIYADVFARYDNVKTSDQRIAALLLGSFVTKAFGITSENPAIYNNLTSSSAIATSTIPSSSTVPRAYLIILFFDNNFQFRQSAFHAVSNRAFRAHEKLKISLTPSADGYAYIYVANESSDGPSMNVYFDDLTIIHQKSEVKPQVLQSADYYPFGLPFNVYNAPRLNVVSRSPTPIYEPELQNRFSFQGQERLSDLNLGYVEFKYRMHDPSIGRFTSVDPLAEKYAHNSPYAFSENNLIHAVELEGLEKNIIFETMKWASPIAFNVNYSWSTHEAKIGFDVSVGLPKFLPFSYREGYGASYSFRDLIQQKPVTETRSFTETSYFGSLSFQTTSYKGSLPQTTGMVTLGTPSMNVQYENDWFPDEAMAILNPFGIHPRSGGDGSDRFKTAALSANYGFATVGFRLATGDPGPFKGENVDYSLGGKGGTYVPRGLGNFLYDPNKYRLGLAHIGSNNFKVGYQSEMIRHQIQNIWTHDNLVPPSPWFQITPQPNQFYLGMSNGSSTQW